MTPVTTGTHAPATITATMRDYHQRFPVSAACPDLARARTVAAFASTVAAHLDLVCRDELPPLPDRDDAAWYVGCEYFLAVAAYRAQQVLDTVLAAMHLCEGGFIMPAWPVLRSAAQMNDHLQLYVHRPTTRTHLQQAYAEVEAWNAVGDASWDYEIPLCDSAFDHLPPVPGQPAVTLPNTDQGIEPGEIRAVLDAAAALTLVNLGRLELGRTRQTLHADSTCEHAEQAMGQLQAAVATDIVVSATDTAIHVVLSDDSVRACGLRSDLADAATEVRHILGAPILD